MLQALRSLIALGALGCLAVHVVRFALALDDREWARLKHYAWMMFGVSALALSSIGIWPFLVIVCFFVHRFGRDLQPAVLLACLLFAVPPYLVRLDVAGTTLLQFRVIDAFSVVCAYTLFKSKSADRKPSGLEAFPLFMAAAWIVYQVVNVYLVSTLSNALKLAVDGWLGTYLVLYVFLLGLRTEHGIREFVTMFSALCVFMAIVAIFEAFRHWLLYPVMEQALGIYSSMGGYLERTTVALLRAQGSTGNPIALSGLLAVGLLISLVASERSTARVHFKYLGVGLILFGLICTFSRGGWVAAFAGLIVYYALAQGGMLKIVQFSLVLAALLGLALVIPGGEKVLDMLPFVGKSEGGSVDYRAQLLEISYFVFLQSPWFGSPDFMDLPIMQALVQGEGIIDVVNTYVGLLLSGGVVALVIFLGMFMPAIWALLKKMARGRDQHTRMAFACLIVVLVLITTVSYVNSIPYLSLLCAGLGISVAAQREAAVR